MMKVCNQIDANCNTHGGRFINRLEQRKYRRLLCRVRKSQLLKGYLLVIKEKPSHTE